MLTLREQCLSLPYLDRLNLCEELRDTILLERRERRPMHPNRCQFLLEKMEQILGEPVKFDSRVTRFVWARTMVAYQLTREGYTLVETGRLMQKDHATIIHMRKKMQDALSFEYAYKDIVDIWKQFQKLIRDDIHTGTTDNLICMGGEFPDCGESAMGEASGEIRSADNL